MMRRIIWAAAACVLLASCGIPSKSVLLFQASPPADISYTDIPDAWKGRLVRARAIGADNTVGGSAAHDHQLAHSHSVQAEPTTDLVRPLGLREVASDALHGHRVESVTTSPALTQPADLLPPSYGLEAIVLTRGISDPRAGLIVGYIGTTVPQGWVLCDGTNGTPDLRDRFILLDGPAGPAGSATHSHAADHTHTWEVGPSEGPPAYFGDPASPAEPSVQPSQRNHGHGAATETLSRGSTDSAANDPPAVAIRFIMATSRARGLPDGIVVPFSGASLPNGWGLLSSLVGDQLNGRMLRAMAAGTDRFALSGQSGHDHQLTSRHELLLAPAAASAGRDRAGGGPQVPDADHGHRVQAELTSRTGASGELPPYVELLLIVKQ